MKKLILIWSTLVALLLLVIIQPSCSFDWKPKYGARYQSMLQTTISADGQMVAVIQERLPEQPLLVRHLTNDNTWRKVPIPPLTKNIRFGLTGHELLIVFHKNETNTDVLAKLDLDMPDKPMEILHEDHYLNYPVEVSKGKILVRIFSIDPKTGKWDSSSSAGILVEKAGQIIALGAIDKRAPYTPSVVGTGYFYFLDSILAGEGMPHIKSYALPNGKAPIIDESFVDKTGRPHPFQTNTTSFICDYKAERCLRGYITEPNQSPYVYAIQIFAKEQRCSFQHASGYFESKSITPDGNTAVFALSGEPSTHVRSPRVVVTHFKPQQCEPVSVQQFNFEEK